MFSMIKLYDYYSCKANRLFRFVAAWLLVDRFSDWQRMLCRLLGNGIILLMTSLKLKRSGIIQLLGKNFKGR